MYSSTLSITSALDGGEWSAPRPGRFTPRKETRYPLYRRLVWTVAESLVSTRIRSPDRPILSESLYRLSYPGPNNGVLVNSIPPLLFDICIHNWGPQASP